MLDKIAVVAAINVSAHARAPMRYFKGSDLRGTHLDRLVPAKFVYAGITPHPQQIGGLRSSHNLCTWILEAPQSRQIEMIHVSMRKQNEIHRRQV